MEANNQKILAIIGPSGCGKSTIVNRLASSGLIAISQTYTDRPKRSGEKEVEHIFVSPAKFNKLKQQNFFIEIVQPFNLPFRYGIPKLEFSSKKIPVLMIRSQFIDLLKKHFPESIIYQIEAPFQLAKENLALRNDLNIGSRLTDFKIEIEQGHMLADRIFLNNGPIYKIVNEIATKLENDFKYI